VALDRQSIEKKDFPLGQHGYEPAAVDAHLTAVANELDEFKYATRRRSDTLASSASEQVRAIVHAAEASAADIQRTAEEEAREIRVDADREAHAIRQQASHEARESFGKVSESTVVMLERLDSMESELNALIESLRTVSGRLNADMQAFEGHVNAVGASLEGPLAFEREPEAAPQLEPQPTAGPPTHDGSGDDGVQAPAAEQTDGVQAPASEQTDGVQAPAAEQADGIGIGIGYDSAPADQPAAEHPDERALPDSAPASDETEGARLIALNMALNGTPRDETARYLGENFQLSDRDRLLDEVYASVEA
jgi:vacuolar-type H+-ATPase subunit H